jgi:hypothetical protein
MIALSLARLSAVMAASGGRYAASLPAAISRVFTSTSTMVIRSGARHSTSASPIGTFRLRPSTRYRVLRSSRAASASPARPRWRDDRRARRTATMSLSRCSTPYSDRFQYRSTAMAMSWSTMSSVLL